MPPKTSQSPSTARATRQKSTLFCPECGHESPIEGDWQVRADVDRDVYDCPACGATVTERPASRATASPVSSRSSSPSAGGSLLARSVRLAFVWAAWPCTPEECALP